LASDFADAIPGVGDDATEEQQVGLAERGEFGDEMAEVSQPEPACCERVFVPGGVFGRVTGGDPQDPSAENPFRIGAVFKDLADGPRVRRMDPIDLFGAQAARQVAEPMELIV